MRRVAAAAGATTGRVTHYFGSRVEVLVAALAEVERRRSLRVATHVELEPMTRIRATLLEFLPLDTGRLNEQRVWLSLCATGVPELRDEVNRQTSERDRLVGSLIDAACGGRADEWVAFSLLAVVDGLAQRLVLDTTTRPRRLAQDALDQALHDIGCSP